VEPGLRREIAVSGDERGCRDGIRLLRASCIPPSGPTPWWRGWAERSWRARNTRWNGCGAKMTGRQSREAAWSPLNSQAASAETSHRSSSRFGACRQHAFRDPGRPVEGGNHRLGGAPRGTEQRMKRCCLRFQESGIPRSRQGRGCIVPGRGQGFDRPVRGRGGSSPSVRRTWDRNGRRSAGLARSNPASARSFRYTRGSVPRRERPRRAGGRSPRRAADS